MNRGECLFSFKKLSWSFIITLILINGTFTKLTVQAEEDGKKLSKEQLSKTQQAFIKHLKEIEKKVHHLDHRLVQEILKQQNHQTIEKLITAHDEENPYVISEIGLKKIINSIMMEKMHQNAVNFDQKNAFTQEMNQEQSKKMLFSYYKKFQKNWLKQTSGGSLSHGESGKTTDWSHEKISHVSLGEFEFFDHLKHLKSWYEGKTRPSTEELGLNFIETHNNDLTVLSDKEQFWPVLMKDLEKAKHHIHIIMFGFMGDEWGKEVTNLLANKVKEGVKVRILADALGARMHWYFKYQNQEFIDSLKAKGIDLILTSNPQTGGNFHFDHRKIYIIDGDVGFNTGYTIEEHMRKIHFDMGLRLEGDIVKQLQSHFLTSYFYFGGKIKGEGDFDQFFSQYYPDFSQGDGTKSMMTLKLLENIPNVQHRVTEQYYDRIKKAKKRVVIINEFLSEERFLKVVEQAAERGIEVEIIYPRTSEWAIHRVTAVNFFDKFKNKSNVQIYLYDGPENHGWLHTKGIVVDDEYINFGSTNFDAPSLYHNYEINIETKDMRVVEEVNEKIIDYAKKYSKKYVSSDSSVESLKLWGAGILSRIPRAFGAL